MSNVDDARSRLYAHRIGGIVSFVNSLPSSARDVTVITLAGGRIKIGALATKGCMAQRAFVEPDRPS